MHITGSLRAQKDKYCDFISDFFVSASSQKIYVDVKADNIKACHKLCNNKKTIVEFFKQTVHMSTSLIRQKRTEKH